MTSLTSESRDVNSFVIHGTQCKVSLLEMAVFDRRERLLIALNFLAQYRGPLNLQPAARLPRLLLSYAARDRGSTYNFHQIILVELAKNQFQLEIRVY